MELSDVAALLATLLIGAAIPLVVQRLNQQSAQRHRASERLEARSDEILTVLSLIDQWLFGLPAPDTTDAIFNEKLRQMLAGKPDLMADVSRVAIRHPNPTIRLNMIDIKGAVLAVENSLLRLAVARRAELRLNVTRTRQDRLSREPGSRSLT